jgi:hypothetical protein
MRPVSGLLRRPVLPEMRHPEVPRSHQRDERSGVTSAQPRHDALRVHVLCNSFAFSAVKSFWFCEMARFLWGQQPIRQAQGKLSAVQKLTPNYVPEAANAAYPAPNTGAS